MIAGPEVDEYLGVGPRHPPFTPLNTRPTEPAGLDLEAGCRSVSTQHPSARKAIGLNTTNAMGKFAILSMMSMTIMIFSIIFLKIK